MNVTHFDGKTGASLEIYDLPTDVLVLVFSLRDG